MYIKNLKLKNFRNYNIINIDFDPHINIIYGKNAAGKTNILESIYLSSTSRSHKNLKENELINFNEEESHIQVELAKGRMIDDDTIIDIHLKRNQKKGLAINKIPIIKISEFIGTENVVMFSPEDLKLIKEGPHQRRKYIDQYITQIDKIYTKNLIDYNKSLTERNKLLRQIKYDKRDDLISTIDAWDESLIKYGEKIISKREEVINDIKNLIEEKSKFITDNKEILKIKYEKNIDIDNFKNELLKNREKDIRYAITNVGPHKDDIKFTIDNIDIRKYGSQGQQRTAAICLKLTELDKIKEKMNDKPILLLDDVFSELDEGRQKKLLENIKDIQVIITATGIEKNILEILKPNKIFKIENNKVYTK